MKVLVRLSLPPVAFAFAVLACAAAGFDQPEAVEVVFLNVGQGDATLIRSPEGKVALIDGGRSVDMFALLQHHGSESV
jgi:beta-lactamase superfamily II metal-dependent hydrolase